jgi:peptide/nickel transport system permease protein
VIHASGELRMGHFVVPNLSGTVVTATTLQIPTLVLTEVALSFLNYGTPEVRSWGTLIADGTRGTCWGQLLEVWWISVVPVVALAVTVVCLSVLGDALGDVLDPRAE